MRICNCISSVAIALIATGLAPHSAIAQLCEPGWRAVGGPNGPVYAMTVWDPDGSGSEPALLVVGGSFTMAGGAPANNIATWDPATGEWRRLGPLGGGVSSAVAALATLPSGDLVAGGLFSRAGGVVVNGVARWDGDEWHAFGSGVSGAIWPSRAPVVLALLGLPGDELIAGGTFTHAGGEQVMGVARWDGDTWRVLGAGLGFVSELAIHSTGALLAGVLFGVCQRDGERWNLLGGIMDPWGTDGASGAVALLALPSGDLIAGGYFLKAGGAPGTQGIARWDGSAWRSVGGGVGGLLGYVTSLALLSGGDLIVGGSFETAGGVPAMHIARWDGAAWSPLGSGIGPSVVLEVSALAVLPGGDLAVGGTFRTAGGLDSPYLAIWRDCPPCYADCDGSGGLDFLDFLCFQNRFAAADPLADCDGSAALDFFDFLCFQNAFAAGCP